MRLFASDRVASIMERLKWPDDEAITAKMVTRAVENAQKQIEELNYERRKNVLKYDDVMNTQREVIYGERRRILEGARLQRSGARDGGGGRGRHRRATYCPRRASSPRTGTSTPLFTALAEVYPVRSTPAERPRAVDHAELQELFVEDALRATRRRSRRSAPDAMRELERMVLLNITDTKWREHLYEMDYLQEGIHLRAYAQKDPLTEYQREAYDMFQEMTESIREEFVRYIYRVEFVRPEAQQAQPQRVRTTARRSRAAATRRRPAGKQPAQVDQRQDAAQRPVSLRLRARSTRSATAPSSDR